MRRKSRPVEPEPVDLPPEIPVVVKPPDPAVRAILAGPPTPTQDRLSDLLSAQPGIEVLARLERADEVLSSVQGLPARRGVAVLIDTGLPGLHDAGWLIRRLRERVPVLRLFAYAEQPDDPLMEHVALAGVDEVLVVAGTDTDDDVVEALVRQFHLSPAPEDPAILEDVPVAPDPLGEEPEVMAPPEVPVPAPLPVQLAQEPAAIQAMPDPPPPPVPVVEPEPTPPPVHVVEPELPSAPAESTPKPEATPDRPAPQKRSRFHRRSEKRRASKPSDPAPAQDGTVESAALRNLERELAAAQRPAPEVLRQAAAERSTSASDGEEGMSGDPVE